MFKNSILTKLRNSILTLVVILLFLFPLYAQDRLFRIACIGDSITYGGGIKDRINNSYPAQLQNLLGKSFEVKNFGVGGSTILRKSNRPYWSQNAFVEAKRYNPDLVILKFGTNDSKDGIWDFNEFIENYREIISVFKEINATCIIFISYPVPAFSNIWNINPKVIENDIQLAITKLVVEEKVGLIDLYTPLKEKEEFFYDKIHPDSRGAKIIAETVYEIITTKLRVKIN